MEDRQQTTPSEAAPADVPITAERLVGMSIRLLREAHELSQEDVAHWMRSSGFKWRQTTVAKTEAGQRPIRVNEVAELSVLFTISAGDLIEWAGDTWITHAWQLRVKARVTRAEAIRDVALRDLQNAEAELRAAQAAYQEAMDQQEELRGTGDPSELSHLRTIIAEAMEKSRLRRGLLTHPGEGPTRPHKEDQPAEGHWQMGEGD